MRPSRVLSLPLQTPATQATVKTTKKQKQTTEKATANTEKLNSFYLVYPRVKNSNDTKFNEHRAKIYFIICAQTN